MAHVGAFRRGREFRIKDFFDLARRGQEGIDPGLTGAVGILRDGAFLGVDDIPTVVKGVGSVKREVDPAGLKKLLKQYWNSDEAMCVVIERMRSFIDGRSRDV